VDVAPDSALLDHAQATGVTATHHMLFDEAARLRQTDQRTVTGCIALIDCMEALIPLA
jgi:hypothetical protein